MKAHFTLKSAINQSTLFSAVALISLVSVIYPEISIAEGLQTHGQSQAVISQIKSQNSDTQNQTEQNSLTIQTVADNDPLVVNLQTYLNQHNSPLAPYAGDMIKLPNWKKALAISFVESNMGIHCVNNNCSGIGGAPGSKTWRKYSTKLDWFIDLNNLLDKPIYSQKYNTFEKMRGVYVQPGSDAWVNGTKQVYAQLTELEENAQEQSLALQNNGPIALAQ